MSIFTALKNSHSVDEAFGAKDCTSAEMTAAIQDWFDLYYRRKATKDRDPCQRIAYTVVNKLTRTCFSEYQATSKAEFAQMLSQRLGDSKKSAMQTLMIGGETFLKPVPTPDGMIFIPIRRDNVRVFGRSADGKPSDIGTTERTTQGRFFFTLLERRSVDAAGRLTIRNKLYRSDAPDMLGQQVPLGTLEQYKDLAPEYTYPEPLGGLGLVYMKLPVENCVDGSKDGVSVYAPAAGLIHNIDRNEAQINGELERGQSKVFASADLMVRDEHGMRKFADDIFVGIDEAPEDTGITIFSPELREQSFLNRKREYLRNVESLIGIKRGLLSEVEAQERTAKEVTSSEGDYNLTIIDLQNVWSEAVKDAIALCGKLGKLYRIPGAHEIAEGAVAIDWGNGVLYDEEKTWADYLDMVARGLLKPEIAIGWRFNMPTETESDLQKIRTKYMPELKALVDGDA